MSLTQTIIGIGVGVIIFAIFGFVIFKLIVILNDQLNRIRKKVNKGSTKKEDTSKEDLNKKIDEKIKELNDMKKEVGK